MSLLAVVPLRRGRECVDSFHELCPRAGGKNGLGSLLDMTVILRVAGGTYIAEPVEFVERTLHRDYRRSRAEES